MKYIIWIAMAVVTLIVMAGGVMKITGNPAATASFTVLGLPTAFATFIGVCEIAGGIGIWLRKTSMLAAIGLGIIMIGALYYHVMHTPIVEGIAAFSVFLCCLLIVARKGTGVIG